MCIRDSYESLAKKKDIDYNFYSELQDEDVLFDGTYLDLIINNLLSNAFKYTEEGERIYVKLYREDKDVYKRQVWYSMPISDLLASLIAGTMLVWQLRKFKAQA